MKKKSIGEPKIYLGGRLRKVVLPNQQEAWDFGSAQYVKAAVKNVEEYLHKQRKNLLACASTPLSPDYHPEVDITEELDPEFASYFQSLIKIFHWMVELGQVDICCEVSMMSSYLALPRCGHLEELFHVFAYLRKNHNAEMVFDPSVLDIDMEDFEHKD